MGSPTTAFFKWILFVVQRMATPGFLLMLNLDQEVSVKKAFSHVLLSRKLHPVLLEEWLPVTGLEPLNRAGREAADD